MLVGLAPGSSMATVPSAAIPRPPTILWVSLIVASAAVLGGGVNRYLHAIEVAKSSGWTSPVVALWAHGGTSLATVAFGTFLLHRRIGWGGWLLIGTYLFLALSALGYAQRVGPTSAFTIIETVRAVGFLLLAVFLGSSLPVKNWLADAEPLPSRSGVDEISGATLSEFRAQRGRAIATAEILMWLWVLAGAPSIVYSLSDFGSFTSSILKGPLAAGLETIAWVTSICAAMVYSFGYSRIRVACVIAPVLSLMVLLTNRFLGLGGLAINLVLLAIALVGWPRLRAAPR